MPPRVSFMTLGSLVNRRVWYVRNCEKSHFDIQCYIIYCMKYAIFKHIINNLFTEFKVSN